MVSTRRSSFAVPALPTKPVGLTVASCPSSHPSKGKPCNVISSAQKGIYPPLPLPPLSKSKKKEENNAVKRGEVAGNNSISDGKLRRSSMNFLQDINPDSCIDLLSIPDPPSTSPKKNRRRMSSPLTDVTNNTSNYIAKRPRRSLAPMTSSSAKLLPSCTDNDSSFDVPRGQKEWFDQEEEVDILSKIGSNDYSLDMKRQKSLRPFATEPANAAGEKMVDGSLIETGINEINEEGMKIEKLDLLGAIDYAATGENDSALLFVRGGKSMNCGLAKNSKTAARNAIVNDGTHNKIKGNPSRRDSCADLKSILFEHQDDQTESSKCSDDGKPVPESKRRGRGEVAIIAEDEKEKQQSQTVEFDSDDFARENAEDFVVKRRRKRHSLDLNVIKDARLEFQHDHNGKVQSACVQSDLQHEAFAEENRPVQQQQKTKNNLKTANKQNLSHDRSDNQVIAYFQDLVKYGANMQHHGTSKSKKILSSKNDEGIAIKEIEDEKLKLRQLVRRYYSLSTLQRSDSDEAREIQNMTGYPLFSAEKFDEHKSSDQDAYEKQQTLFTKLVPIVERMDQNKIKECKLYEELTGYRAEKSRGKRYRYVSLSSNTRIPPQDYEKIYKEVQQKLTSERSTDISKFLEFEAPSVSKVSLGAEDKSQSKSSICINEGKDEDKDKKNPIPASVRKDGRQVILPLPARNDIPTDPDICFAHQQLWAAIDVALESYSRAVLAIQASDKSKLK